MQAQRGKITLSIRARVALRLAPLGLIFFGILPPLPAQTPASTPVILILVDTLRADRLSCYGYRKIRTPNIDSLARGGTLFSRVNAQVPLTLPSHASFLTSTYPFVYGVEDNGEALPPGAVTLATALKARGYRTGAFVGGFALDRRFGLDQGFDVYDSPFDLHRHRGQDPGDIKRRGENVARAATEWLNENSAGPFFLFLHLYDLHTPYDLPPELRARFGPGYDGELRYVDDVLGGFVKFLADRGLLDKSLVVFTSDHGESLGEHGEKTHGYFIYQSTMHVPLIIRWPTGAPAFPPRVEEPAGLLDLAPTILAALGVERPATFQGRSLLGLMDAKSRATPGEVYGESLYAAKHFGASALRSLRAGRHKYIEAPKPEVYDLERDPGEARNLYASQKSLALALGERLRAQRGRYQPASRPAGPKALSPEAIARLSSLGYAAVSAGSAATVESGPDPKDRIAEFERYGRAITLASAGRLVEANTILEALLAQDADLLAVRTSWGLNLQRAGQHPEALDQFRRVLKKDPANVIAHYNAAVSLRQLRRLDEAVRELQAALAVAPYYTNAEGLLGLIWIEKKDYARARAHLGRVLEVAPTDYGAHYNLGVLETMEGRWTEGERHLRAAIQSDPESAEARNTLGSVHLQRGDLDLARQEFAAALRLEPKFAWAHYNLGLAYRRQGKTADAAQAFRQALAADPNFQAARDALSRLAGSPK